MECMATEKIISREIVSRRVPAGLFDAVGRIWIVWQVCGVECSPLDGGRWRTRIQMRRQGPSLRIWRPSTGRWHSLRAYRRVPLLTRGWCITGLALDSTP